MMRPFTSYAKQPEWYGNGKRWRQELAGLMNLEDGVIVLTSRLSGDSCVDGSLVLARAVGSLV